LIAQQFADHVCRVVSLKDPNTFSRIKQPARFADISDNDLQAFELESFLDVAEKTLKWIEPHNMKASSVQNLQVGISVGQGCRVWGAMRSTGP
jgi:hypothetical protein